MDVTEIDALRDGGTIRFRVVGPPLEGAYSLQTPLLGEPRPLFRDERRLEFGSDDEKQVVKALQTWMESKLTPQISEAMAELDKPDVWKNLSGSLEQALPLYRIRALIQYLEARNR